MTSSGVLFVLYASCVHVIGWGNCGSQSYFYGVPTGVPTIATSYPSEQSNIEAIKIVKRLTKHGKVQDHLSQC